MNSLLRLALEGVQEPWVAFDLDGTLAYYDEWRGIEHIGEPIPPTVALLKEHLANGDTVKIFTARVAEAETREAATTYIQEWCLQHIGQVLPVTHEKDTGMTKLYDDRAVQIEKNTGVVVE